LKNEIESKELEANESNEIIKRHGKNLKDHKL